MAEQTLDEDQGLSLLDLLIAVGQHKLHVLALALAGAALGVGAALWLPNVYTAKTALLPPAQSGGANSLSASLGALAAVAGLGGGGGALKSPEELYVALLKSDTIANNLIVQFKLQERYEKKTLVDTRQQLAKEMRVTGDKKSGLVMVEVDDEDPQFAANMANTLSDELRKLLTHVAVTEAQQRRAYFESQVSKAKEALIKAEMVVKNRQEATGILSLDTQTQTALAASAQIRGQIVAREVQLKALRSFAGPEHPELKKLLAELASLKDELAKLEGGRGEAALEAKATDGKTTEALNSVRAFRELKFQEAIYAAMVQQYTLAAADEAKEAPLVQQVDVAQPPDKKSKPARALIAVGATFAGLMLGLLWAAVRAMQAASATQPQTAARWQALRHAWGLRRG